MKYREMVDKALEDRRTALDKLLAYAYYRGREEADKQVSDMYRDQMRKIREDARKMRYYKSVLSILPASDYIYTPDYAGDHSSEFGGDEFEGE